MSNCFFFIQLFSRSTRANFFILFALFLNNYQLCYNIRAILYTYYLHFINNMVRYNVVISKKKINIYIYKNKGIKTGLIVSFNITYIYDLLLSEFISVNVFILALKMNLFIINKYLSRSNFIKYA